MGDDDNKRKHLSDPKVYTKLEDHRLFVVFYSYLSYEYNAFF